jgi:hypothetical protein
MVLENSKDLKRNMKVKDAYDLDYDKGKLKKVKDKKKQRIRKLDFERVGKMGRDKKGNLIKKNSGFKKGRRDDKKGRRDNKKFRKGKMKRRYGDSFKNKQKQSKN